MNSTGATPTNARSPLKVHPSIFAEESEKILARFAENQNLSQIKNGSIDVVDLFSGCGGLSYGFHLLEKSFESFRIAEAIDTDRHANNTYHVNFGLEPLEIDLLSTPAHQVAKTIQDRTAVSEPIVLGGPPCVAFSSHKKKDKRFDQRSSLVVHFAEIAVALKARLIVMENVPDLMGKRHWQHFQGFRKVLEDGGYNITYGILNMAEFGVPQFRHRLVCLASKTLYPSLPSGWLGNGSFKTVRDTIAHLEHLDAGEKSKSDPLHVTSSHRQSTVDVIKQIPLDGGSRPMGVGPECLDKVQGFYDVYGRLYWDRPSVTLTARCRTPSCGRYIHPEQHRGLSVREASLLQGFPPDFKIEGPFDDKFKQIGNSVAPIFSLALAEHVHGLERGYIGPLDCRQELPNEPPFGSYSGSIARNSRATSTQVLGVEKE